MIKWIIRRKKRILLEKLSWIILEIYIVFEIIIFYEIDICDIVILCVYIYVLDVLFIN